MSTEYAGSFVNPAELDPTRYVTMWKRVGSEWVMVRSFPFRYLDENYFHGAMETTADDGRTLRWFEQGVNPNDDYTVAGAGFRERGTKRFALIPAGPSGMCYSNAAKYLTPVFGSGGGGKLVHGIITSAVASNFGHAWIEEGGDVIDPTAGVRMEKSKWYKLLNARPQVKYTPTQAIRMQIQAGHFGPWTLGEEAEHLSGGKNRTDLGRPQHFRERGTKMREQGDKKFVQPSGIYGKPPKATPEQLEKAFKIGAYHGGTAGTQDEFDAGLTPNKGDTERAYKEGVAELASSMGYVWGQSPDEILWSFKDGFERGLDGRVDHTGERAFFSERTGHRMKKFGDREIVKEFIREVVIPQKLYRTIRPIESLWAYIAEETGQDENTVRWAMSSHDVRWPDDVMFSERTPHRFVAPRGLFG